MSTRKHKTAENIENLCPVSRKRSTSKSATIAGLSSSSSKTAVASYYEHASSPSALTYEALEEMGIGMLDSEESSSSAIALAVSASATSDENSNETTPHANAPRMAHQQAQRINLALGSNTANVTLEDSSCDSHNATVVELHPEDATSQAKMTVLASEISSNSNSPSKRTRNPLATVTTNSQTDSPNKRTRNPLITVTGNNPTASPILNLLPSTSKQALLRQQKKHIPPTTAPLPVAPTSLQKNLLRTGGNFFVYRTPLVSAHIISGINYFDKLSDEILLGIFKWLPKKTLLRMATVCRRFNRCARDETLWTRLDLGLRTLCPTALEQIVLRGILVLRLAQAEIQDPAFAPSSSIDFQSRLQYLDLSLASISQISLQTLLAHCRQLKKLSLEHAELNDEICLEISKNKSLETINLSMSSGLTANSVRIMMESLTNLSSLNISWTDLSADAVTALVANISSNVIRLNVAGCRRVLFDSHVVTLQKRCPQLLELDLSDCNSLTPTSIASIMKFNMLEYLSLSRCYLIPATTFIELKGMPSLNYLDIFGMLSDAAMEVLEKQMPKMGINKFIHSSVARPTVGTRRTSIWGLRTRD
ncbi:S-phase kinase-associated protein 2 [Drosophila tropicalis]|uniref:S-phase kinase-associated protein 2 n=1 Tax=Drosophila tropicalis TaxID=46794 RepID=UPI0035AC04DD